jgi:acid stress chaperone HdeB
MRADVVLAGAFLALFSGLPAHAQVTIDASKVTCDQFVHAKVGAPRTVAAWLSGFYQGKRDNAVIDKQNFETNLSKLVAFCYDEKNFDVPVMQAIERAINLPSSKPPARR